MALFWERSVGEIAKSKKFFCWKTGGGMDQGSCLKEIQGCRCMALLEVSIVRLG